MPLYRLEHLVTRVEVLKLREMAIAHGLPFPTFVASVFAIGLKEVEVLGITEETGVLDKFQSWMHASSPNSTPSPRRAVQLLQEMFLLWNPVSQKDFEHHLRGVEDPREWQERRRTLDWWFDYCNLYDISPALLVDQGARG